MVSAALFCSLMLISQEAPKSAVPKRPGTTIPAPGMALEGSTSPGAPTRNPLLGPPPDIDLRMVELQALVNHYQRLCDTLLELEFEYEMAIIDTGPDHPEKNRGIKRLEVLTRRKEETRKKIYSLRGELQHDGHRNLPAPK